ncbi:PAAR repeat-containing protein [Burkholderia vietnamiensis G4]|uniref:PAAR repeat-containing protein n=1 Tax=Burkholderia vietnamiensis (strain G4 / LMG 22486) TaxID=269482 RepID=A4JFE9_BURVG|nr:PAAR repeat-containing protein [Burkholderia vietnamiensis G4]
MDAFIVEGDTTSHGGRVLGCEATMNIDGKKIARLGDMVSCPRCGGVYPIVSSKNPGFNVLGRAAAFEGDKTACGASLISSQTLAHARVPMGSGGAGGLTAEHEATANQTGSYRGRFQVLDETTGKPVANHPYSLQTADGQTLSGTTDAGGYTQWHEASSPASLHFASDATGSGAGAGSDAGGAA